MKLEFKNVTKQYGEVNAVNKVNCVMEKGIYGLLGVNGAGKTTLMRMLCTIVQPSEGQILWNGKDIWKLGGEYREVLGYLPQDFGYYPDLTVYDYMMYISSIKGLKIPFARKKVKQLLNQVGMEKFSKRKMKNLSGGMVRRVGIAQAMLNDPQILVLDEPTAGLDPNERIRFRNLISELSEERLVLLSTHIVSDIEYKNLFWFSFDFIAHLLMFKRKSHACFFVWCSKQRTHLFSRAKSSRSFTKKCEGDPIKNRRFASSCLPADQKKRCFCQT